MRKRTKVRQKLNGYKAGAGGGGKLYKNCSEGILEKKSYLACPNLVNIGMELFMIF